VRLESSTRRKIRHGHKLKLRYKVVAVETDGESFTSSARTRARR
jgi:hypothetical protein